MNVNEYMKKVGQQARASSKLMAVASCGDKNIALLSIASHLESSVVELRAANAKDLAAGKANGLDDALLDRLELTEAGIASMAEGCRQVAALADPIGEVTDMNYLPSGIQVGKMRVPLGVIGIIYESRPNVTVDAAILCLKSSNSTVLRGGSEAIHSNMGLKMLCK